MRLEQRLVESPLRGEHKGVPLVRRRVARIELDGTPESLLRTTPVPVVNEETPRQRRVRFRQRIVERDRLSRVELGVLEALVHRHVPIIDVQRVGVGKPGVSQRVVRIERDRFLEVLDAFGDSFRSALVPGVAAAQVQPIRFHVLGVAVARRRDDIRERSRAELGDDCARDLVLDRKDVVQLPVVALRPHEATVFRRRQLRRDTKVVAGAAQSSFKHFRSFEERADGAHILRLSLERKDRRARRYA